MGANASPTTPQELQTWCIDVLDNLHAVDAADYWMIGRDAWRFAARVGAAELLDDAYKMTNPFRALHIWNERTCPGSIFSGTTLRHYRQIVAVLSRIIGWCASRTTKNGPRTELQTDAIRFGDDYRSCQWGRETFMFTPKQSDCVRVMDDARRRGTSILHQRTILGEAESAMADDPKPQMKRLFRGHPAWGTLIVSAGRGMFQLADPPEIEAVP